MATTTISNFAITELRSSDDDPYHYLSDIFNTDEEALDWLHGRAPEINAAMLSGWLRGVQLLETRIPARFILAKPDASRNYLGFGARVVQEVNGIQVIGVPVEHARWQSMRLARGLQLASRDLDGYESLEAAIADAQDMAV